MYLVHLRVSDGATFAVRCRELSRDALVPGHILMLGVLDPVPTAQGPFNANAWSVGPTDIANYMQGDYPPPPPPPSPADDCDDQSQGPTSTSATAPTP